MSSAKSESLVARGLIVVSGPVLKEGGVDVRQSISEDWRACNSVNKLSTAEVRQLLLDIHFGVYGKLSSYHLCVTAMLVCMLNIYQQIYARKRTLLIFLGRKVQRWGEARVAVITFLHTHLFEKKKWPHWRMTLGSIVGKSPVHCPLTQWMLPV